MIHHSNKKHVSSNTVTTEVKTSELCGGRTPSTNVASREKGASQHISIDRYLEIEQEVLWLRELRQKSDRAQAELLIEIKSLNEKLQRLKAQNEVLNNCWLKEQENHTRAQTEVRVWAGRAAFKDSEIGELRRRVVELESHLNPGEVA